MIDPIQLQATSCPVLLSGALTADTENLRNLRPAGPGPTQSPDLDVHVPGGCFASDHQLPERVEGEVGPSA